MLGAENPGLKKTDMVTVLTKRTAKGSESRSEGEYWFKCSRVKMGLASYW